MDATSPTALRCGLSATFHRLLGLGVLLAVAGPGMCPGARADTLSAASPAYTFGVVPQHAATELAARWTPLLRYLSGKTGLPLEFHTARDIPTFEQRMVQGEYDFAYLNPFQYALFQEKVGYRLLAREHIRGLRGIVVVRADAPYRRLRDLADRSLAFPAPSAFAASLVTRAEFRTQGIRIQSRFVSSHDSVYYGVANGLFSAGGGILDTFQRLAPALRAKLRVLWTSPAYVPHAFAAHPRLPVAAVATLRRALLAAAREPEGARLLAAAGFETLTVADDREYESVRRLAPAIRAELCALPETPAATRTWLCPASLAGSAVHARAAADVR